VASPRGLFLALGLMDRSTYIHQFKVASLHFRRAVLTYGPPGAVVQLVIVIAMYVALQSHPENQSTVFATALAFSLAAALFVVVPAAKAFRGHAPICPSCGKPLSLLTWRSAISSGVCPYCRGTLYEP
jgi:hypothetical protein